MQVAEQLTPKQEHGGEVRRASEIKTPFKLNDALVCTACEESKLEDQSELLSTNWHHLPA